MLNILADFWSSYRVPVIAALPVIALFALQYFLCARTERRLPQAVPFLLPLVCVVLAVYCWLARPGSGGFIDLSGVVALLLAIYAAVCAAAILLARLAFWLRHRAR